MQRVAIIGGGLSGLTVALRRARAGDDVVLFEATSRLGGQLHSQRDDGFVIEHGAEGFVARSSAVPALASDVGCAGALVEQLVHTSFGFQDGRLLALAPGQAAQLLGFQVPADELGRGIRSFALGMGQLSDALATALAKRAELATTTTVQALERRGARWRIETSAGETSADALVLATNARAAAQLLAKPLGQLGERLAFAATLSSVTVTLAFSRAAVAHPLDGTGFIVAAEEQREGCRACTFVSSKFPARAPATVALFRLFFRPESEDFALSDAAWTARALRQLARVVPVEGTPLQSWVSRWQDALPVFDDAHRARVAAVESGLAGERLLLAGAAFHGSGIDAAVRSAERAAAALG